MQELLNIPRYKLFLRSKDNNIIEYSSDREDLNEAINDSIKLIEEKGWTHYDYRVEDVVKL